MAVDDELAAIVELDLDDAIGRRFKVQIRVFQNLLDMRQHAACGRVESGFVQINSRHGVPC